MALPTFNGFSLQDTTYFTRKINFRTRSPRVTESRVIARRLGKKFINQQIQEKTIIISGIIKATDASGLQDAVDDLLQNVSDVEGSLVIETGRTYTATARSIDIPERTFSQTVVPFEIDFVAAQPYAEGSAETANFVVTSGTGSLSFSTTISGTVLNRPSFTFTLPSGTGNSLVVGLSVQNQETANTVTLSGTFTAESEVIFNYNDYVVTVAGTETDFTGQMDDFDPGTNTFTVTVSGTNDGTRSNISYNPRYW